jgi:hypothetical protein
VDVAAKEVTDTDGVVVFVEPAVVPENTANTKYVVLTVRVSPENVLPAVSSAWVAVPSGIAPLGVFTVL